MKFTKRALALTLSMLMILSVCVVSAEHTINTVVPEQGVIFFDDFEDWTIADGTWAWNSEMTHATTGIWSNAPVGETLPFRTDASGNNTVAIVGKAGINANSNNLRIDFEKNTSLVAGSLSANRRPGTLNSGQVLIEYDISIPSVYDATIPVVRGGTAYYPTIAAHNTNIGTDNTLTTGTYSQGRLFFIERDASNIMVSCYLTPGVNGVSGTSYANPRATSYYCSIPVADRTEDLPYYAILPGFDAQGNVLPHNFKTFIDYEAGVLEVYVDNELYYRFTADSATMKHYYSVGQILFRPLGTFYANAAATSEVYGYDKDGDFAEIDIDNVKVATVGDIEMSVDSAAGNTIVLKASSPMEYEANLIPAEVQVTNDSTSAKVEVESLVMSEDGTTLTITLAESLSGSSYSVTNLTDRLVSRDFPGKFGWKEGETISLSGAEYLVNETFETGFPFTSSDPKAGKNYGQPGDWAAITTSGDCGYTSDIGGGYGNLPGFDSRYSEAYWESLGWGFYWDWYTPTAIYGVADDPDGGKVLSINVGGNGNYAQTGRTFCVPFTKAVSSGILDVSFELAYDSINTSNIDTRIGFGLRDEKLTPVRTGDRLMTQDYSWITKWTPSVLFGGWTVKDGTNNFFVAASPYSAHSLNDYAYSRLHADSGFTTSTGKIGTEYEITNQNIRGIANMVNVRFVVDLDNDRFDIYQNGTLLRSCEYLPGNHVGGVYDAFTITDWNTGFLFNEKGTKSIYLDNVKVLHTASEAAPKNEAKAPTIYIRGEAASDATKAAITDTSVIRAYTSFTNTGANLVGGTLYLAAYKDGVLTGCKTANYAAAAGKAGLEVVAKGSDGFTGADEIRAFVFANDGSLKPLTVSLDK